jgi:hypothetical protein
MNPQTTQGEDVKPEDTASGNDPNTPPERRDDDARSDLEQAVSARSDAVERGEGGSEPDPMLKSGDYSGVSGDGGEVKNLGLTQQ